MQPSPILLPQPLREHFSDKVIPSINGDQPDQDCLGGLQVGEDLQEGGLGLELDQAR